MESSQQQVKNVGANLTGIDATSVKDSGGNVKIQAQHSLVLYTFGSNSTTIGDNVINVGSNIKLGNAGVQLTAKFSVVMDLVNQINASGIISQHHYLRVMVHHQQFFMNLMMIQRSSEDTTLSRAFSNSVV